MTESNNTGMTESNNTQSVGLDAHKDSVDVAYAPAVPRRHRHTCSRRSPVVWISPEGFGSNVP